MEILEAIKSRHSRRNFNLKSVPRKLIEEFIDCARLAPTARNVQPWHFIAVTNKESLIALAALAAENGTFIKESSCCIAVFCEETKYYLEDGSAATTSILIAASGLGLAACWVAGDKKPYCDKVKELLSVPFGFKLVSLIALGYSDEKTQGPPKKNLKDILHWERF